MYGDDLDTLRTLAADLRTRLTKVHGLTDLQIKKQVLIPQIKIHIDYDKLGRYGVAPGALLVSLQQMVEGERVTQIVEGNRRFDLVVRLPEKDRGLHALQSLMIETPTGAVRLANLATIEDGDGPNQVSRENSRRRIVLSANTDGSDMAKVVADIRSELAAKALPEGYCGLAGRAVPGAGQASRLFAMLAMLSLTMIFLVLLPPLRSTALTLIIMGNIPLALVGSVIALWISGQPLSVAAFIASSP